MRPRPLDGLFLALLLLLAAWCARDHRIRAQAAQTTAQALDSQRYAVQVVQQTTAEHAMQLNRLHHVPPTLQTVSTQLRALDARETRHWLAANRWAR